MKILFTLILILFNFLNLLAQENKVKTGCVSGNCKKKTGTFVYEDGSKYIGEWKDKKRNGTGILYGGPTDPPGWKYDGEWLNDEKHGYGVSGNYHGNWVNGKMNGQGVLYVSARGKGSDIIEYEGEWLDNKRHGFGKEYMVKVDNMGEISTSFVYFDGQWRNGLKIKGKLYNTSNNLVYDGEFGFDDEFDKYNGYGIKYGISGKIEYEGNWSKGKKEGVGTYKWENGDRFEGLWNKDKRNGKGTLYQSDGFLKTGQWQDDECYDCVFTDTQGNPVKVEKNITKDYGGGYIYVGDFLNGKKHGKGIYTWPNGQIYEGEYENDKPNGKGILYLKSGDIYSGDFVNGKREGEGILVSPDNIGRRGNWIEGVNRKNVFEKVEYADYLSLFSKKPGVFVLEGELKDIAIKNSYSKKNGLYGNVKNIKYSMLPVNNYDEVLVFNNKFDEIGNIIETTFNDDYEDEVFKVKYRFCPEEFMFEDLYIEDFGHYRNTFEVNGYSSGSSGTVNAKIIFKYAYGRIKQVNDYCNQKSHIYGEKDKICSSLEFVYDNKGNLIKKLIPGYGNNDISVEYEWTNGKLTMKKVYSPSKQNFFQYLYKIEYIGNKQIIYEYKNNKPTKLERKLILRFDEDGKVSEKQIIEYTQHYHNYNWVSRKSGKKVYTYRYENGFLVHVDIYSEFYGFKGNEAYGTYPLELHKGNSEIIIKRDNHGNIIEHNNNYGYKCNYKYDLKGNWIEREIVKTRGSTPRYYNKIIREISYY